MTPPHARRTRCPKPECGHVFDISENKLGKNGNCPVCDWRFTFTPLEALEKIERERLALSERGRREDAARHPVSAVLEDIRSLWNVGSIFRTADGAGLEQLILCGITGQPPRKEIAKTALGAEEAVPWHYVETALEAVDNLRQNGRQIIALENTEQSITLSEISLNAPLAFVVGNEVTGVSQAVLDTADIHVRLPMYGAKASLNVSVAFGIAAYGLVGRLV